MAQPIGVLTLVTITVVQARAERRALRACVVAAVAASTVGIAGFVVLAAGTEIVAVLAVSVLVLVVVGIAMLGPRRTRCIAFGIVGGGCYGLVPVLVHMAGLTLRFGAVSGAVAPAVGTACSALVGGWLVQQAYASGPPDVVMACTTVIDPLVAIGIGMVLPGESGGAGAFVMAGEAACAAVSNAGVVAIARFRVAGPYDGPYGGAAGERRSPTRDQLPEGT